MRSRKLRKVILLMIIALFIGGCAPQAGGSQGEVPFAIPLGDETQDLTAEIQLLILLTSLAFIPFFLLVTTAFIRITVVLSIVRSAIGIPQLPPNQVVIALSLFLTFFVMHPVWEQVNESALQPYLQGVLTQQEALEIGMQPLRSFMLKQARQEDMALFVHLAGIPRPRTPEDLPTYVLIPAYVVSELKTAFQMAFVIYIPFLIIDMVVSSALLSMGMMMLPPTVVSLPFKLLLFVMVDGWHLLARSLVLSFGA
ncbi:MAG: flagellar type III secretion system pore protein FliP [Anaerolineae bacterium]